MPPNRVVGEMDMDRDISLRALPPGVQLVYHHCNDVGKLNISGKYRDTWIPEWLYVLLDSYRYPPAFLFLGEV